MQQYKQEHFGDKIIGKSQYMTHDNGTFAFRVFIEKNNIKIFKPSPNSQIEDWNNIEIYFNLLVISINNPLKVFFGIHISEYPEKLPDGFGYGNSFLFEIEPTSFKRRYIHVGIEIFLFETPCEIIKYSSILRGSDCPCPYALDSENRAYILEEKISYFWNEKMKDPYVEYIYTNYKKDGEWKQSVMFSKMDVIKIEKRHGF
jgi:hypothetical protein